MNIFPQGIKIHINCSQSSLKLGLVSIIRVRANSRILNSGDSGRTAASLCVWTEDLVWIASFVKIWSLSVLPLSPEYKIQLLPYTALTLVSDSYPASHVQKTLIFNVPYLFKDLILYANKTWICHVTHIDWCQFPIRVTMTISVLNWVLILQWTLPKWKNFDTPLVTQF